MRERPIVKLLSLALGTVGMKLTGCKILAVVLCVAVRTAVGLKANPSPKPYSECDKPSDEFFYLVQQWPPGYCEVEECRRGYEPPAKFTIHGFWPNYCQNVPGKDYPEFCSREKVDLAKLSRLVPALRSQWPSLSNKGDSWFWEHEWDKHGTCALAYTPFGLDSQYEYFETTLQLAQQSNLYESLSSRGIVPGGEYSVSDIQDALNAVLGGDAYLHCQEGNILVEIYLCYNQELQFVPCSQQGTCSGRRPVQYVEAGSAGSTA